MSEQFLLKSIGYIKKNEEETKIIIEEKYQAALLKLEEFSHLIVLWWITGRDNENDRSHFVVRPCIEGSRENSPETGVFACRSPLRPNPIGLTIVKILKVKGNTIFIKRIDAFDGTPIIDLKPYIPKSDCILNVILPTFMKTLAIPREE